MWATVVVPALAQTASDDAASLEEQLAVQEARNQELRRRIAFVRQLGEITNGISLIAGAVPINCPGNTLLVGFDDLLTGDNLPGNALPKAMCRHGQ